VRLLFDQNISFKIISLLKSEFEDSQHVKDLNLVDATDHEIWSYAKANNCVIVTFDSDFYDFSLVWGHPPKIIWIRLLNQTTNFVAQILKERKSAIASFVQTSDLACLEIIQN
jgi:predicted nuclease of predicted toxin-antitoxin system